MAHEVHERIYAKSQQHLHQATRATCPLIPDATGSRPVSGLPISRNLHNNSAVLYYSPHERGKRKRRVASLTLTGAGTLTDCRENSIRNQANAGPPCPLAGHLGWHEPRRAAGPQHVYGSAGTLPCAQPGQEDQAGGRAAAPILCSSDYGCCEKVTHNLPTYLVGSRRTSSMRCRGRVDKGKTKRLSGGLEMCWPVSLPAAPGDTPPSYAVQ